MNPNEKAYEALKRWQKALSLTDSDTQLVPPNRNQENQPSANPKDVEFYKKQYQEAMERGYPLSERDRRELESLRQVLHLKEEDTLAIEQQLAKTVLQTNETTVEPSRAILDESDPRMRPSTPSAAPQNIDSGMETADPNPSSQNTSPFQNEAELEQLLNQFPPNEQESIRQLPPDEQENIRQLLKISQNEAELEQFLNQFPPNKQPYLRHLLKLLNKEKPGAANIPASHEVGQDAAANLGQSGTEGTATSGEVEQASATLTAVSAGADPDPGDREAAKSEPGIGGTGTTKNLNNPKPKIARNFWPLIIPFLLAIPVVIAAVVLFMLKNHSAPSTQDPDAASQYFQTGTQQARQGQNAKAIADLDQAIRLSPNDPNLYLNRGVAQYQAGNLSAALDNYNQALKLNSNFAEAWSNRSRVYVDQRRYDDAINDASRAIQLNENLTEAYLNRGNALFGKNNLDGAAQDYQKVLQLPPAPENQSKAYNNLGNINAARNELDTAITNYDRAIEQVRSYPDAFFNRAIALQRKNQCPEAVQGFRDAANLYQNKGNSQMQQRAQSNAERLQPCTTSPGSPQPSPTSSV